MAVDILHSEVTEVVGLGKKPLADIQPLHIGDYLGKNRMDMMGNRTDADGKKPLGEIQELNLGDYLSKNGMDLNGNVTR